MRFLIDENVPPRITQFLKKQRYDVYDLREHNQQGIADRTVYNIAQKEKRVIITFDSDFSNILEYPPLKHFGIIVIRIHPPLLEKIQVNLSEVLEEIKTMDKTLLILEEDGYRIRKG